MILLHAIGRHAGRLPGPDGVEAYVAHGLAVFHREVAGAPAPDKEQLLAFGVVLEGLARQQTVLPLRFGSVVADRAGLMALVEERHGEWTAVLDRVAGLHELIVHLPDPAPVPAPAPATEDSGRGYLLARAAAVHAEEEQVEVLRGLPTVREARPLPRRRVTLLVRDVEEARRQVTGCWPGQDLRITGPWPPFSFCEVSGS